MKNAIRNVTYLCLLNIAFGIGITYGQNILTANVASLTSPPHEGEVLAPVASELEKEIEFLQETFNIKDPIVSDAIGYQSIDHDKLEKLDGILGGLKNLDLSKAASEPKYAALLYDVICTGRVLDIQTDPNENSCYHTTYTVEIIDCTKRPKWLADKKIIKVLQYDGPIGNSGKEVYTMGRPHFEKDQEYFFVLSSSRVRFMSNSKNFPDEQVPCNVKYSIEQFVASDRSIPITQKDDIEKFLDNSEDVLEVLRGSK